MMRSSRSKLALTYAMSLTHAPALFPGRRSRNSPPAMVQNAGFDAGRLRATGEFVGSAQKRSREADVTASPSRPGGQPLETLEAGGAVPLVASSFWRRHPHDSGTCNVIVVVRIRARPARRRSGRRERGGAA